MFAIELVHFPLHAFVIYLIGGLTVMELIEVSHFKIGMQ